MHSILSYSGDLPGMELHNFVENIDSYPKVRIRPSSKMLFGAERCFSVPSDA
jgi:hypothetical protein